jgi:hypothetical protein
VKISLGRLEEHPALRDLRRAMFEATNKC